MPYHLKKLASGKYKVVEGAGGAHPGHEFSKKPQTKAKALAQLRALMANSGGK